MSKDDDALFEEAMASLVIPSGQEHPGSGSLLGEAFGEHLGGLTDRLGTQSVLVEAQEPDTDASTDERLFRDAIGELSSDLENAEAAAEPTRTGPPVGNRRAMERLIRRGELKADTTLDLHGLTQSQAWTALERCIHRSQRSGHTVLRVICGKGLHSHKQAVLLEALQSWLRGPLQEHVKASYPSAPRHGGRGAWLLILR